VIDAGGTHVKVYCPGNKEPCRDGLKSREPYDVGPHGAHAATTEYLLTVFLFLQDTNAR
jgi:hypothetical protein